MVLINPDDPQSAAQYDDRTSEAVRAVLIEIAQVLGDFEGRYAIVGGAVPWLLLENEDMPHVGTLDVDIALAAAELGEGQYATLIEALMSAGYEQRGKAFQLVRNVKPIDDGPPIDVVVDFLRPTDAEIVKNTPPLVSDFAVIRGSGTGLALQFYEMVAIAGRMPAGGNNRVEIAVASIPALLVMKGFAIKKRFKRKDAYDIHYSIRNYPGGIEALAPACVRLLTFEDAVTAFGYIGEKFDEPNGFGPSCVRQFVESSQIQADLTLDQWQQDAFGQVDALLRAMGLRP